MALTCPTVFLPATVARAAAPQIRAVTAPRPHGRVANQVFGRAQAGSCTQAPATPRGDVAARAASDQVSGEVAAGATEWFQKTVTLQDYRRGCHVITRAIYDAVPEIAEFEIGMCNFFIKHTSASLTINENASPDVPLDLADTLDRIVPEGNATKGYQYRHLDEGPDDMPAHVKSSLMGPSLSIPISQGRLATGTWQGIYLNEHRNYGGRRSIVVTIQGVRRPDGRSYGSPSHRY